MLRLALGTVLLGIGLTLRAATIDVSVEPMSFAPAQVNVRVGDSVRWTLAAPTPGSGYGDPEPNAVAHNVSSDTGGFRSGEPQVGPWQFSHVFTQPGTYRYHCERHGAPGGIGMSGTVVVQAATLQINEGLAGAWFNPATSGQGFFFDVHPGSNLFGLAWFTWTEQPGVYDWLTGVGRYAGGERAGLAQPHARRAVQRATGRQQRRCGYGDHHLQRLQPRPAGIRALRAGAQRRHRSGEVVAAQPALRAAAGRPMRRPPP